MQILGYRHFEVGGISPWTVIEGGPLDETNTLYQAHQLAYADLVGRQAVATEAAQHLRPLTHIL